MMMAVMLLLNLMMVATEMMIAMTEVFVVMMRMLLLINVQYDHATHDTRVMTWVKKRLCKGRKQCMDLTGFNMGLSIKYDGTEHR